MLHSSIIESKFVNKFAVDENENFDGIFLDNKFECFDQIQTNHKIDDVDNLNPSIMNLSADIDIEAVLFSNERSEEAQTETIRSISSPSSTPDPDTIYNIYSKPLLDQYMNNVSSETLHKSNSQNEEEEESVSSSNTRGKKRISNNDKITGKRRKSNVSEVNLQTSSKPKQDKDANVPEIADNIVFLNERVLVAEKMLHLSIIKSKLVASDHQSAVDENENFDGIFLDNKFECFDQIQADHEIDDVDNLNPSIMNLSPDIDIEAVLFSNERSEETQTETIRPISSEIKNVSSSHHIPGVSSASSTPDHPELENNQVLLNKPMLDQIMENVEKKTQKKLFTGKYPDILFPNKFNYVKNQPIHVILDEKEIVDNRHDGATEANKDKIVFELICNDSFPIEAMHEDNLNFHKELGIYLFNLNRYIEAYENFEIVLNMARVRNDIRLQIISLFYLRNILTRKLEIIKEMKTDNFYEQKQLILFHIEIYVKLRLKIMVKNGKYLSKKHFLLKKYNEQVKYEDTIIVYEDFLDNSKIDKSEEIVLQIRIQLADIHLILKQTEKALKNYKKAYLLALKLQDYKTMIIIFKKLNEISKINSNTKSSLCAEKH